LATFYIVSANFFRLKRASLVVKRADYQFQSHAVISVRLICSIKDGFERAVIMVIQGGPHHCVGLV